jgi:hypothetical protein
MADLLVVVLVLAFFGLCVAFVRGCDRIIGPDDDAELETPPPVDDRVPEPVG